MRSVAASLGLFLCCTTCLLAEDAQLRAAAVELVEHSVEASTVKQSGPIPNETVITFQARGADGTTRSGSYSRLYAKPGHVREEFTFGDFHLVRITLADRVVIVGPSPLIPPEEREMLKLIPIQLWHLDHDDIVNTIVKSSKAGMPVNCIEFDTVRGTEKYANEMCFESASGALVYDRSGNEELINSEFFDFSGAKEPGHIQQLRSGNVVLDVHVSRRIITDPINDDVFTPPVGSRQSLFCKTYQRPFGQSMPQPPGNGATRTDILVHAVVGTDGRVQDAAIEVSDRPDLNDEALKVLQAWTFTPAMCDGRPSAQPVSLVVHFQGR